MKNLNWKGLLLHQYFVIGVMVLTVLYNWTFVWSKILPAMYYLISLIAGFGFVYMDTWFSQLILSGKYTKPIWSQIISEENQPMMVMRSWLFLFVTLVLLFFVRTSTTSFFVGGLVAGIAWHLVYDLVVDRLVFKQLSRWQQGIRIIINERETDILLVVVSTVFLVLLIRI